VTDSIGPGLTGACANAPKQTSDEVSTTAVGRSMGRENATREGQDGLATCSS
jgi:hypothetical protein